MHATRCGPTISLTIVSLAAAISFCLASNSQRLLEQRRGRGNGFLYEDIGAPYNEDWIDAEIDLVASPYHARDTSFQNGRYRQQRYDNDQWSTNENNNNDYGSYNQPSYDANDNNYDYSQNYDSEGSYGSSQSYPSSSSDSDYNNQNSYNSPYTSRSPTTRPTTTSSTTTTTTTTTSTTTAAPATLTCGRSKSGMIDPFGVSNQNRTTREKHLDFLKKLLSGETKIVGGIDARQGEVCWQVNLLDDRLINADKGYCGGSILSDRWILTAAHCVANSSATDLFITPDNLMILAGSIVSDPSAPTNLTNTMCSQRLATRRIIVYPYFRTRTSTNSSYLLVNDLALIELATPINLNSSCSCPICLATPAKQPSVGQLGVVTGFGCQITDPECPEAFPLILQWTQSALLADNDRLCFANIAPGTFDAYAESVTFCAGGFFGIGACAGDSGGPYVQWDNVTMRFYQEGVLSYGAGGNGETCAAGLAARFTEVNQFLAFIKQYVPEAQILP